jgi:hypothetical protein
MERKQKAKNSGAFAKGYPDASFEVINKHELFRFYYLEIQNNIDQKKRN